MYKSRRRNIRRYSVSGDLINCWKMLHKAAKETWKKVYNEDPPALNPSEETDLGKVILCSFATGTVISGAKLSSKRYIMIKRHG